MKKIIVILIIFIIFILAVIFFIKSNYKNNKIGNNKSIEEIENYILNIKNYKATLTINVKNNRNENNYKIMQEVNAEYEKQTVIEPEEIKGLEIVLKDKKIEVKNTNLNLSNIYENYPNVYENNLFLTQFIENYKLQKESNIKIKENYIIMEIKTENNKYDDTQRLYVNMDTLKPEKLEILQNNNTIRVYILYNEIEINI